MEQVAAAVDAETYRKLRAYIRALLRINDKMRIDDIRRTVTVSPQMKDQHVIRLVYWITPSEIALVKYVASLNSVAQLHIACVAEPMGVGRLYLVINTQVYVKAKTSIHAIDLFLEVRRN